MAAIEVTLENISARPRTHKLLRFWRRFAKNKLAAIALAFIIFQIILAVFASQIAPYNPYKGDFLATWETPNYVHWLGTDDLGRDVLSRLLYGARISISIGILSQLAVAFVGVPVGAIAGLKGGWLDYAIMRVIDVLSSLPTILFLHFANGCARRGILESDFGDDFDGLDRHCQISSRSGFYRLKKRISSVPRVRWAQIIFIF